MDLLGALTDAGALEDPEGALAMLGYDVVEVLRAVDLQAGAVLEHFLEHDITLEVTTGPACEWDDVDERRALTATLVLGMVGGIIAQREKAAEESGDPGW